MMQRVALGMSSGIDSSVAAILLKNSGLDVIGVTFVFSEKDAQNTEMHNTVRTLAESFKIKHYTIDLRKEFNEKIISYFIKEYQSGRTPFPCAVCNPNVKFSNLLKFANQNESQFIATGHYSQIVEYELNKYISKGNDPDKDQSFFLWGLPFAVVNRLRFPLGKLTKNEVRNIAKSNGLEALIQKQESLGICFTEGNNYREYLKSRGMKPLSGHFVDKNGVILGRHNGTINYTIGQRRGLGINLNIPMFVAEIRPATNQVVLSEFHELYKTRIYIKDYHFIHPDTLNGQTVYSVKIRYRLQETPCKIHIENNNQALLELLEPVAMVANGQTAVLYDENRVIGGGFIDNSE